SPGLARVSWSLLVLGVLGLTAPGLVAAARLPTSLERARELQTEVAERYAQGRYREAIPKARQALALREQALSPDDPLVADSLQSLADLLRETAAYGEARPLYERALRSREKTLGQNHPAVASTLTELGVLLTRAGDYAAARPLLERGLAIRE